MPKKVKRMTVDVKITDAEKFQQFIKEVAKACMDKRVPEEIVDKVRDAYNKLVEQHG